MSYSQLAAELAERASRGAPITVGLAGAGQMGADIVVQVSLMAGIRIGAISEVRPQRAFDAALLAGHSPITPLAMPWGCSACTRCRIARGPAMPRRCS